MLRCRRAQIRSVQIMFPVERKHLLTRTFVSHRYNQNSIEQTIRQLAKDRTEIYRYLYCPRLNYLAVVYTYATVVNEPDKIMHTKAAEQEIHRAFTGIS